MSEAIALNQYLTFTMDNELFALEISSVREVLDMTSITRIPKMPRFMRGVINLRGNAVPVVDLRTKFDMGETQKNVNTCIIIVEVVVSGERIIMGALADSVQEVFYLEPGQIEPAPRMGTSVRADFIKGMGKQDNRFIMLLDIGKVFSEEELEVVKASGDINTDLGEAAA